MNKDELEKEADNFCDKVNKRLLSTNYGVSPYSNRVSILDVQEAYIAGAEPREKRIAELENENADLQKSYEELYNSMRMIKDQRNELEKENTELKAEMEAKQVVLNDFKSRVETVTGRLNKKSSQLIKATELLKWALHSDPEHDDLVDFDTKWKEAEQFLKEVET